jgi:glutathione peroxidase-family protein
VSSLYDLKTTTLLGKPADLSAYLGKVTLVVNVASYCGLSGKAFSVLGFPSNDFGEVGRAWASTIGAGA